MSGIQCAHGLARPDDDACLRAVDALYDRLREGGLIGGGTHIISIVSAASQAVESFPRVFDNEANREWIKSCLVADGVNMILNEQYKGIDSARVVSVGVTMMENFRHFFPHIVGDTGEPLTLTDKELTTTDKDFTSNRGICSGCPRSTIQFFRRRLQCDCLDAVYAAAKSKHPSRTSRCGGCGETRETKALLLCSGCRREEYCSRACQVADWSNGHKELCQIIAETYRNT